MRRLLPLALLLPAPAWAAPGEYGFFSLRNSEFVVIIAFLVFVAILLWFRVPSTVAAMLDRRADAIRKELQEARALREEAQALLASFERRKGEMAEQSARIVAEARAEAGRAAEAAREEAARSVARRLASAEEQIAAAEAKAVRAVKDRAVAVALGAAEEVLSRQLSQADAARLIDESIETVGRRLN